MIVKLLVVHGRPVGKVLRFGPGDYFLGRGPECHVRFNSDWVSRQHCLLRIGQEGASLRDLGSRNGTLINGDLCEGESSLAEGDLLQIGPLVFKVHLEAEGPVKASGVLERPPTLLSETGEPTTEEPHLGGTADHPSLQDPGPEK